MGSIKVWTKQNENVLKELESKGRYTAKREYIIKDLDEHANLVLEVYDWLVKNSPGAFQKPADANYPIWVSMEREATMLPSPGTVIIELTVDSDIITMVNIDKWGTILNYSYIPSDEKDRMSHRKYLEQYGTSDAQAYMSRFYPHIKRNIIESWSRLFDDSIILGSSKCYGNIWEVRKEWISEIIR